jgi:hypothetical protein
MKRAGMSRSLIPALVTHNLKPLEIKDYESEERYNTADCKAAKQIVAALKKGNHF